MYASFNDCHQQKTTCTFLYIEKEKNAKRFYMHKKQDTSQKARQFPLRFIYKKHDTLHYAIFVKMLKLAFIYKKHDTLRYVTFIYTKIRALLKKQDNLLCVFIYKIWTLCVTRFLIEFLKLAEVGGTFHIKKIMHFAFYFYIRKIMHFALRCYRQKA